VPDSKQLYCERCLTSLDEEKSVRNVTISIDATGEISLNEKYSAKALCDRCYGEITEHIMKFMLGLE